MKVQSILAGLLLATAVGAGTAHAQIFASVGGIVVDEKGKPVQGVQITIEADGEGTAKPVVLTTDKKGSFRQERILAGKYKIALAKPGLTTITGPLELAKGQNKDLGEIKMKPESAATPSAFARAADLSKEGKYDEAVALYKDILAKNATSTTPLPAEDEAKIHFNVGVISEKKQDWVEAENSYRKAVELDPLLIQAYHGLGNVYQQQKKMDDAIELFAKATETHPDNGGLVYELGLFYREKGRHEEAYAALQKAAALMPDNAEVQYYLGTTAINLNKIPEALQYLEKYLTMNPTNKDNIESAKQIIPALKQATNVK